VSVLVMVEAGGASTAVVRRPSVITPSVLSNSTVVFGHGSPQRPAYTDGTRCR
jgi:hypothetical protein